MQVEFATVDVFTDRQFGGNPLAVVAGRVTATHIGGTCVPMMRGVIELR
jgi:hypothetical protein